jgi:hypothetical protein
MEAVNSRRIKRKSSFLVTINTNIVARMKDMKELSAVLRATLNKLYTSRNLAPRIKFVGGAERDLKKIRSVDVKFVIERGTNAKGMRLHAHCLVDIKHYSRIQLDPPGIKEFVLHDINKRLTRAGFPEVTSIYVNVRHVPNNYSVLRYLKKTGKAKKIPKWELELFEEDEPKKKGK